MKTTTTTNEITGIKAVVNKKLNLIELYSADGYLFLQGHMDTDKAQKIEDEKYNN